jgi:hypothetical protein
MICLFLTTSFLFLNVKHFSKEEPVEDDFGDAVEDTPDAISNYIDKQIDK